MSMLQNTRTNILYDSYRMLHPNGSFMCFCNKKKVQFYLKNNLAVMIDSHTMQLTFEPNGVGNGHVDYYSKPLDNKCVCCGDTTISNLTKHHVVPAVFRKRLPAELKNHNHHDILPICTKCHEEYEQFANDLKADLTRMCGGAMNHKSTPEERYNSTIEKAIKTLQKHHNGKFTLPEARLQQLNLISQQPMVASSVEARTFWADKIVATLTNESEITDFIKMWRKHFVEHAKPKYLPQKWDVDHPIHIID